MPGDSRISELSSSVRPIVRDSDPTQNRSNSLVKQAEWLRSTDGARHEQYLAQVHCAAAERNAYCQTWLGNGRPVPALAGKGMVATKPGAAQEGARCN